MDLSIEQIMLGLTWPLEPPEPSNLAAQYWQKIKGWLTQNHQLEPLVTVISGALIQAELNVLLSPQDQPNKSYTEAFHHWIGLISLVQNQKSEITNHTVYQGTTFITKSSPHLRQETIFVQIKKKLYALDNKPKKNDQELDRWLKDHPNQIKNLINEIGKPIFGHELKLLFTDEPVDANKKTMAQQYWATLLQYIRTQYNPHILEQITHETALFLKKSVSQNLAKPNASPQTQTGLLHSLWRWHPVPEGEDKHSELACQSQNLPHGFKMIAARVRGKKHKHDGSHCDDWFEIACSGDWGIIAVSDGAGSKMFSRIGAKVACETAVRYLSQQLKTHQINTRTTWSPETFARNELYQFKAPDLEMSQQLLHQAIQLAYEAVEKAYLARDHLKYYYKTLGNRDLTLSDFASTLLLAIHTTVEYQATNYSFILTCQVGDGISAAIYKNKAATSVLGEIETNGFQGETEFLTSSRKKLERDYLAAKTFPFFSPMRVLMVMTDGVSDDYFPPDKGMLRLFGHLVLNGIIPVTYQPFNKETIERLKQKKNKYLSFEERLTEKGPCPTPICSVEPYAKLMNRSIEELVANPQLLAAGQPSEICNNKTSLENRLQTWLDTYNMRGSFDDRTLVVLFNEQQASDLKVL